MFEFPLIIKNNSIVPVHPLDVAQKQVYEVIRFIDGLPIFFDEHFDRFGLSCQLAGVSYEMERSRFATLLVELARANGVKCCNMKYLVNVTEGVADFYAGFIKSSYPTAGMYENGVSLGLLHEERSNPNAKILNTSLRSMANAMIDRHRFFEVALVNQLNEITEGSRSNLFFIDADGNVITAPLNDVLGGITRQVILEEMQALKLPLIEKALAVTDMSGIVAGFVTGTSPSVLPISTIDCYTLNVQNSTIRLLSQRYLDRLGKDKADFIQAYL